MEYGGTTAYTFASGRTWTSPRGWRPGDQAPINSFGNTVRTRYGNQENFARGYERYARGGYIRADEMNAMVRDVPCTCQLCRGMQLGYGGGLMQDRATGTAGIQGREEYERREQERREQRERERQARRVRMEAAKVRAEETLRMVLLPDELAVYEKTKQIIVTGADKRRYRIADGVVNNVLLLGGYGETLAALCCHPELYASGDNEPLPHRDAHIAQILYLRYDLDKFWATANIEFHDPVTRDEYYNQRTLRDRARAGLAQIRRWDAG